MVALNLHDGDSERRLRHVLAGYLVGGPVLALAFAASGWLAVLGVAN